MVDGEWIVEPTRVKEAFRNHFASRFQHPSSGHSHINFTFPNTLSQEQTKDLEKHMSTDEIRKAVWDCGENKSTGCNSSFVSLIPKVLDAKFVSDFRPISLIGSMYKVITKILANRLSSVISDIVSDVQTAFVSNRQILDGPFIINELLSWCKRKKKRAMLFKVDFAKAYDSVRWDFLMMSYARLALVLNRDRGFRVVSVRQWLRSLLMGVLSPIIEAGMFKGILIDNSVMISHLFYADDAVFVGKWSDSNLDRILQVLQCFYLASGLKINVQKSNLMGVGVNHYDLAEVAFKLGCSILKTPFKYLGVIIGSSMSRVRAWEDTLCKIKSRLSNWKTKTLLIGERLTLLKVVLGATLIYVMSLYKVPKTVLNVMESIRSKFFNGINGGDKKITWIKWVWRFISQEDSLWFRLVRAIHGNNINRIQAANVSPWVSILREVHSLRARGIDLVSHCKKRVGDGLNTCFWEDTWMGDQPFKLMFSCIYALESNKLCTVAEKCHPNALDQTFQRSIRGGVESQQYTQLHDLIRALILSNTTDRWVSDLNGSSDFMVKDVRSMIDDFMLPKEPDATRWIKCIPIKVNVFAWKV
ncbi:RNA-directed DNA polymerase, eukaryota [Tanacetum coccineum]